MPTSSADLQHSSAAPPDPSDKGYDSEAEPYLDDDEEYEEIEVEEEVEVEEEGEEEIAQVCSPIDEDRREDTHVEESSRGTPRISDQSETRQEDESRVNGEDSKYQKIGHLVASEDYELQEFANYKKDSGALAGKRTPKDRGDAYYHSEAPLCGSGIMNAETTKPFGVSGKEVTAAVSVGNGFNEEANGVLGSEDEAERMCVQSGKDIKQRAPSLDVPLIRSRSLSPGAELKDGNKRPAVICDYFAKGWCIKGDSCRFLHIKDHVDATSQQHEGATAAANQKTKKSELQADEGLRDGTERSGLAGFPSAAASAVAHSTSISSERILPWECEEGPRWKSESQELQFYKDNPRTISSSKDAGRESLRQNLYFEDYGLKGSSPICRDSSFLGIFSSSSVLTSDIHQSTKISSYAPSMEEMAGKSNQFMHDDHSLPVFSPLNSISSTSLPATELLPTNHISSWTRSSLSFSSPSWTSDFLGTRKRLDGDGEYHASRSDSLQRSLSPFSGSESENLSWTNVSGDPLLSAGYKTKFFSNDWVPSVPFRPSFFIPPVLSSPGSQYDPIRDSIEQPNLDGSSNFSSSSQGLSVVSANLQRNAYPVLTGSFGLENSSNKLGLSSHNVLDKDWNGRDLLTAATDIVGTAVAEPQHRNTLPKEEKLLSSANVRDITKANKLCIDSESILQRHEPRHKAESKGDRARHSNEVNDDLKTDGNVLMESKALKHFRAALVDFVKELVKPTWREGQLSKDAHKMIVKKAVDKVLSTLQPHQTPSTAESVKLYLSSSQPKIAKLVEGYVDKYGKS